MGFETFKKNDNVPIADTLISRIGLFILAISISLGEQQITGNKSQNYLLDRIKHVLDNEPTMKPTPYNSVQDWNLDQYDDDYYYGKLVF